MVDVSSGGLTVIKYTLDQGDSQCACLSDLESLNGERGREDSRERTARGENLF